MVVDDLLSLGGFLADAAASDPLSALLLVIGHVILLFSIGAFGLLALGAVIATLRPE